MAEETKEPPLPDASVAPVVDPSVVPVPGDPSVAPAETPAGPPKPVNKLHEWGAAVLIMVVLTAILAFFLSFMRGSSF